MRSVVGIDEVGYGPKLGPMMVVGCETLVTEDFDWFETLSHVVSTSVDSYPDRLPIADSKEVFRRRRHSTRSTIRWPDHSCLPDGYPPADLEILEAVTLAAVYASTGFVPESVGALLDEVCLDASAVRAPAGFRRVPLPLFDSIQPEQLHQLRNALADTSAQVTKLRSVILSPEQFNSACETHRSKAVVNARCMWRVAHRAAEESSEQVLAIAGRVSGMKYYGRCFPLENLVAIRRETDACSEYELRTSLQSRVDEHYVMRFVTGVESESFEAALASIVGKYLRELFMLEFNSRFATLLTEAGCELVRPTAGYPTDALRFVDEVAEGLGEGHPALSGIWRNS